MLYKDLKIYAWVVGGATSSGQYKDTSEIVDPTYNIRISGDIIIKRDDEYYAVPLVIQGEYDNPQEAFLAMSTLYEQFEKISDNILNKYILQNSHDPNVIIGQTKFDIEREFFKWVSFEKFKSLKDTPGINKEPIKLTFPEKFFNEGETTNS